MLLLDWIGAVRPVIEAVRAKRAAEAQKKAIEEAKQQR